MDYLYKIAVEIDDEKVLSLQQHDLNAVYKTVREAFADCSFNELSTNDNQLVFVIGDGNDYRILEETVNREQYGVGFRLGNT